MEYHIKYANAFAFLFDVSSRESFESAKEIHDVWIRTSQALGETPFSVLIGNIECELNPEGKANTREREVQCEEARLLADTWKCEYLEVDASAPEARIAAVTRISTQMIKNSSKASLSPGVSFPYNPKPPQRLRLRRYLDRIGLGALLKPYPK